MRTILGELIIISMLITRALKCKPSAVDMNNIDLEKPYRGVLYNKRSSIYEHGSWLAATNRNNKA